MKIILTFLGKLVSDEQHSCKRKVRYGPNSAIRATQEMSAKHNKEYEAYECRYCGGWHIGTSRGVNL